MSWLVLGVVLWIAAHLPKSAAPAAHARWVSTLGEDRVKGVVALALTVSIALMVLGWRSTLPTHVYTPPAWGPLATNVLVLVGLFFFVASALPTNAKRVVRHPQLLGVAIWTAAHLISNGAQRSLILFGGIGAWALVEMVTINRRDGAWQKPEPGPMAAEWKPVAAAAVAFAVLYFVHPWIAGVSPEPR